MLNNVCDIGVSAYREFKITRCGFMYMEIAFGDVGTSRVCQNDLCMWLHPVPLQTPPPVILLYVTE